MSRDFYPGTPLTERPNRRLLTESIRDYFEIWPGHWNASFDFISDEFTYKHAVQGYCAKLHEHRRNGFGLFIYGPPGVGKTALGVIVLRNAIAREGTVVCKTADEVMDAFDSYYPEKNLLPNGAPVVMGLKEADFILIDGLFKDQSRNKDLRFIDRLIEHRAACNRPTIITSSLYGAGLKEVMKKTPALQGEFGAYGKFIGIRVDGPNLRQSDQLDDELGE